MYLRTMTITISVLLHLPLLITGSHFLNMPRIEISKGETSVAMFFQEQILSSTNPEINEQEIINDKKVEIPALEGQMGGLTYYMFSIEPGTLLKMSFVLHRTKANEEEMPTYQRLLVPTRLKSLTKFIDGDDGEGGGFFPNSLILNLDMPFFLPFQTT